jgi:hypothetical protein
MQMLIDFDEIAKLSPIATAIIAAVGVWIAKKNLDRWHVETTGKRKAELAEQALLTFEGFHQLDVWFQVGLAYGMWHVTGDRRGAEPGICDPGRAARTRWQSHGTLACCNLSSFSGTSPMTQTRTVIYA